MVDNAINNAGVNPQMLACLNGRDECLALLIQFGVSLKVESKGDAIKDAMLHASYYSDESSVTWKRYGTLETWTLSETGCIRCVSLAGA